MHLKSILNAKTIYVDDSHLNLEQVYYGLVERICHNHQLPVCGKELLKLILQREQESTMIYPSGIAIPHIRMDDFDDLVVGICFLKKPIIAGDIPVRWVALVITDKSSSKLYLNLVAALMRISKNEAMMTRLLTCNNSTELYNSLSDMNIVVKEDLALRDIMITEPVSIHPEACLREMSKLMNENKISFLPVVDHNNRYLGEVHILNYLKVGVPDYLMMMDNIQFLRAFEPLEKLLEREEHVHVKDIMVKDEDVLSPDASIIETVFEMIQHQKRYYAVVENGKLVGVVTAMDVYRKVIRA